MAQAVLAVTFQCGGESISASYVRTGDHPNTYVVTLPAGKDVTSWVKTDANTAACNLPSGHGYSNGNFDVYWELTGVKYVRYGVPGTISTNALSLDGGTGDDFPASATTGIVVTKQVEINTAIDGDAITAVGVMLQIAQSGITTTGHVDFKDSGPATISAQTLVANVPKIWDITGGATNAFTGNPIVDCYATNGNSTYDATLYVLSLEDSTP